MEAWRPWKNIPNISGEKNPKQRTQHKIHLKKRDEIQKEIKHEIFTSVCYLQTIMKNNLSYSSDN